ncbi:NIF family HAD-type phosphatase [Stenotrophomonas sp. Nf4]|uniref:NIF family HAD-type phosphatase n=2 Tax=unclassified Stenotrophomonas TaxID=196198 RepID=UPI000D15D383|nr:NIF family HAD-type phosphatase [Stenotrophomonas sp. Nf4]PTA72731.1 hypothetical protein C9412_04555 [Stenotrophomonas sp. Nf1]PTA82444.1 hypothetical protein C9416_04505 [Stenotrophomonas sp. Nf4]
MRPTILAMDLEGTLISNAVSQMPRPGLCEFLETVNELFEHLVIYTSVPEPAFRRIAALLVGEGCAPAWFAQMPYTSWSGATKDLQNVSPIPGAALLLDDYRAYIHPGQEGCWVEVSLFESPYEASDTGLDVALGKLRECLTART